MYVFCLSNNDNEWGDGSDFHGVYSTVFEKRALEMKGFIHDTTRPI